MSGLCGWVGAADPATLDLMLAAVPHRGDRVDRAFPPGAAIGYRSFGGRPGQAPSIVRRGSITAACAGELTPAAACPATAVMDSLGDSRSPAALPRSALDGSFAAALWDEAGERLTLLCDPFGMRSICWVEHRGALYFATEVKQLLAIPGLPVDIDPAAIHAYLTFSFVAGDRLPVRGVRRISPGRVVERRRGVWREEPYVHLREEIDPALHDDQAAAARVDALGRAAVRARLPASGDVGLYLSGGLDSSTIGRWLRDEGAGIRAFSLDFGEHSVERSEALAAARSLDLPLHFVSAGPDAVGPVLGDLVWRMDLPFGDGVTGPHYLLARAAHREGLTAVFNGEGGDQLFGGWANKPMIAAEVYAPESSLAARAEAYLCTYHRFYKLEKELYSPSFEASVAGELGERDERRGLLLRELGSPDLTTFMGRLRKTDIAIKGADNILPRAERIAGGFGVDIRSPLFDRALTEASFTFPPRQKLRGVVEKMAIKNAMDGRLPDEVVWRGKSGMCVPTTDWVLGPLREVASDLLGPGSIARRGLFKPAYVARLRGGKDQGSEMRPRRIGEKLWALVILELWLRTFIDGRGRRPEAT